MDVAVMDRLEDILFSCEYNGGGHKYPFRKCVAERWECR